MERIVQANIQRFERLLATETDPTKRAIILRLLEEQTEELKAATVRKREGAPPAY